MQSSQKKVLGLAVVTLLALSVQTSAQAQNLICAIESAAGISFDKAAKNWRPTTFASKEKFVVSKSTNSNARWEIKTLGSSTPTAWCKDDYTHEGQLKCGGFFQDYYINKISLRFIHTYYAGYWNEESARRLFPNRTEGDDTPMLAVGVCTPI